jgi:hypothetical protein
VLTEPTSSPSESGPEPRSKISSSSSAARCFSLSRSSVHPASDTAAGPASASLPAAAIRSAASVGVDASQR